MDTHGHISTSSWLVVLIGTVEVLILIGALVGGVWLMVDTVTLLVREWLHQRRSITAVVPESPRNGEPAQPASARCRELIAEAMIVRERLSGQIDAATYRSRMNDLVSGHR